jgi:hypothetical protein
MSTQAQYLSVSGEVVEHSSTGAGHPSDEVPSSEVEDWSNDDMLLLLSPSLGSNNLMDEEFGHLQRQITVELQANVNHRPVKVPCHYN